MTSAQTPAVTKDLAQHLRPFQFGLMIGQTVVVETVQRLIAARKLPPTIALMGPPGTGKTTMGRLIAAALNCENPDGPAEPCGVCEQCQLIQRDAHPDVQQIDCATHGSVDEMRGLIETAPLRAAMGKVRVILLEEFQEASALARTSLNRLAEEPPANTVICLTTTKPAAIPAPIMTRCLQLQFGPVDDSEMSSYLAEVADELEMVLETEALSELVRMAAGSVRTAANALGRQIGVDGTITAEDVRRTAAPVNEQNIADVLDSVCQRNPIGALESLQKIPRALRNFDYVLAPFLSQLHACYLTASMPGVDVSPFTDCSQSVSKRLTPMAMQAGAAQLTAWLDITNEIANKPARLMSDDAHLQMLLVRLCHAGVNNDPSKPASAQTVQVKEAEAILPAAVAAKVAAQEEARSEFADRFKTINWAGAEGMVSKSGSALLKKGWAAVKPQRFENGALFLTAPARGSAMAARGEIEKILLEAANGAIVSIEWSKP